MTILTELLPLASFSPYDVSMSSESVETDGSLGDIGTDELETIAANELAETALTLSRVLAELAAQLRPFPSFFGMVSVQAIELEPPFTPSQDWGCVVVNPEGRICQLDIREMPGIAGVTEMDQVEEFHEPEFTDTEFIIYAATAIRVIIDELRRQGK